MMKKLLYLNRFFAALAIAMSLVACGGGGGGGSAPTGTGADGGGNNNGGGSQTAIVASVSTPTYTGDILTAYNLLNTARGTCGVGLLAQSATLDKAALNHDNYLLANNTRGHTETSGLPGFTGVDPSARATAAGYGSPQVTEVIGMVVPGSASDVVNNLLGAPYHAMILFDGLRDVGIGSAATSSGTQTVVNLGIAAGMVQTQPTSVVTYPCAGVSGLVAVNSNENPSPLPSVQNATWGQPINVRGAADLSIKSASITGPQGSLAIQAIYGTGQTADPNGFYAKPGYGVIIPAPMTPNTTYTATVNYVSSGAAGATTFTFTTGAY